MDKRAIIPDNAPDPQGGYSPAIVANGFVFASGQAALDAKTAQVVSNDIAVQTEKTLDNLEAVLTAAGSSLAGVVKSTVHIARIESFDEFDQVYRARMPEPFPARTTVASELAPDVLVEIDVVALLIDRR